MNSTHNTLYKYGIKLLNSTGLCKYYYKQFNHISGFIIHLTQLRQEWKEFLNLTRN